MIHKGDITMQSKIGNLLKQIRKEKGITLKDLANRTNLSISYLSMLERGLNNPTIDNLLKICNVLDIWMNDLLLNLDYNNIVVKKENRRIIFNDKSGIIYYAATEGKKHMKGVYMVVTSCMEHTAQKHTSDEYGVIIKGSMVMYVEGVKYELNEGDTIYVYANSEHSFYKTSKEDCESIWVLNDTSGKEGIHISRI